jgi:hypothetical protein
MTSFDMWLHLEILKEKSIAIRAQVEVENIWNFEKKFRKTIKITFHMDF